MAGSASKIMPPDDDHQPSAEEVKAQCKRVVSSPMFRGSGAQGKLLHELVRRCLENLPTTELEVGLQLRGEKFYPPENPWVRVTAGKLRLSLKRYYDGPGKTDPVIIAIPQPQNQPKEGRNSKTRHPQKGRVRVAAGESYKPQFSRNPLDYCERLLRLGIAHIKRADNYHVIQGLNYLGEAQNAGVFDPAIHIHTAEALIVLAESLKYDDSVVSQMISEGTIASRDDLPDYLLNFATEHTHALLDLGREYYWIVFGLQACISLTEQPPNYTTARLIIENALTLIDEDVFFRRFPRLYETLYEVGKTIARTNTVLGWLKNDAEKYYDDPNPRCAYADFLLRERRYEEAKAEIQTALKLDRNHIHANLLLLRLLKDTGKLTEYDVHREMVKRLLDNCDLPWFCNKFPPL